MTVHSRPWDGLVTLLDPDAVSARACLPGWHPSWAPLHRLARPCCPRTPDRGLSCAGGCDGICLHHIVPIATEFALLLTARGGAQVRCREAPEVPSMVFVRESWVMEAECALVGSSAGTSSSATAASSFVFRVAKTSELKLTYDVVQVKACCVS